MATNRTTTGVIWSAVERFSTMGIQFILNIIIARILAPSDFGVIGMLAVFLSICQCLIDGGFSSALIQTNRRTDKDYGTVFLFNIAISIFLYGVLFISSSGISRFYNLPILEPVLKVIGINIIIGSLANVQRAILTINVDFRTQSLVSITGALLSGGIGIYLAYIGYGVWALVAQTLINGAVQSGLLWILSKDKFKICFDEDSFKRLGGFGVKLMLASLLHTVYENLYSLFIGKRFNSQELGYYSRADQFGVFSASTLAIVIGRVAYPVLSQKQDDKSELRKLYTKFIKVSTFIVFPIMILLSALSKQVVLTLLTEKWLPIVPLLMVLAIEGMCAPLNKINLSLLQAVGRSDLFLRLEIIKKTIAVCILLFSIRYGVFWVCIGRLFYSVLATLINMYFTVRIIDKSYYEQVKDWMPNFLSSLIVGIGAFFMANAISNAFVSLLLTLVCGVCLYLLLSRIMSNDVYNMVTSIARDYLKRLKKTRE